MLNRTPGTSRNISYTLQAIMKLALNVILKAKQGTGSHGRGNRCAGAWHGRSALGWHQGTRIPQPCPESCFKHQAVTEKSCSPQETLLLTEHRVTAQPRSSLRNWTLTLCSLSKNRLKLLSLLLCRRGALSAMFPDGASRCCEV